MPIRPPIAKIIQFIVGTEEGQFATLADANAAATAHRDAIFAAGDTWSIPGDPGDTPPGSGPIDAIDGSNSGVFINTHYDTSGHLLPVDVADPLGTKRVNYHWDEYHAPPPP